MNIYKVMLIDNMNVIDIFKNRKYNKKILIITMDIYKVMLKALLKEFRRALLYFIKRCLY